MKQHTLLLYTGLTIMMHCYLDIILLIEKAMAQLNCGIPSLWVFGQYGLTTLCLSQTHTATNYTAWSKAFTPRYQHSHLVVVQIFVCFFPISTPSLCFFPRVPFLVARCSFVKHSIFSVCFSHEPSWTPDVRWSCPFWDTSVLVYQRQQKEFFLGTRYADLPLDDDK